MAIMRKKLSDQIRAALADEIISGQFKTGTRIDEQMIVERFDVSRTPAREALLQLSSEGLVELVPRQGAVVKAVSTRDYICLLEVLVALESLAARLCVRRASVEQKEQMARALDICRQAVENSDAASYAAANGSFHEAIYAATHNEVLIKEVKLVRARMAGARRHQPFSLARMRSSVVEHEAIFEAIAAGDEDAAYAAMHTHISAGGNAFADVLASLPQG
jgi:DNA-binding GntR family transcriptional regulator